MKNGQLIVVPVAEQTKTKHSRGDEQRSEVRRFSRFEFSYTRTLNIRPSHCEYAGIDRHKLAILRVYTNRNLQSFRSNITYRRVDLPSVTQFTTN